MKDFDSIDWDSDSTYKESWYSSLYIFIIILCFFVFFLPTPTYGWERDEIILEACVEASYLIDWSQTRQIKNNPSMQESGCFKLIGTHPTNEQVDLYFAGLMVSHFLIANYLKNDWRKIFQMGTLYMSINTINHNYSLGLKIKF